MNVVPYGLPSPLVLGLAADLILQLLLLSMLALPLALRRLRRRVDARWPLRRSRFLIAAGTVILASLPALFVASDSLEAMPPPAPLPCAPHADAQRLGLRAGAIVVDPRPGVAFRSYHLAGSCHRRLEEIPAVAAAHPGATIYVADDTEFPEAHLEAFRGDGVDVRPLPGGLQAFYKPGGHAFGFGEMPHDVVNADGPVAISVGPFWFMGVQSSVRPLSQRPEAEARGGATLVDVRDHGGDLPAYDAYFDRLPDGPILVLCDDPPSCLAADALASSRVRGKIRTLRTAEALRAGRVIADGFGFFVLAFLFMFFFAIAVHLPRWASVSVPLGAIAAAYVAPRFVGGALFVYAVDAPVLGLLLVLLALVWLYRHESATGRSRIRVRVLVGASIVFVALSELFGQGSGGLHTMSVGTFAVGLLALHVRDRWVAQQTIHPLRFADARAGGKAARLAETVRRGANVPVGVVVHDAFDGDLRAEVRRLIGGGPYVVRSSAAGEDEKGAATAGRYESLRDVGADGLGAATTKVRQKYDAGAVLIQRQISGRLAGVSEDAPLGLLRIEAAEGSSNALLQGAGAALRGVGSAEGEWADIDLPIGAFVRVHDRARGDSAVQSEWVVKGRTLWIVQVRDVAEGELHHPEAAEMVDALRAAWVRKKERVVLSNASLADYDGAADATVDLMERLLGAGPWRDTAEALLGLRLPVAAPAVVRLGGRLFANQVPARPVRTALSLPLRRFRLWWLRRRKEHVLRRIHEALTLASREGESLESAAPPAIALSLLTSLTDSSPGVAGDPFLEALARGESTTMPGRTSPDLALRLPREGTAPLPVIPPLGDDFLGTLGELRGCARQLLAHHLCEYRRRRGLDLAEAPVLSMPVTMTLPMLERFALGGASSIGDAQECGVWIGEALPGEYIVGKTVVVVDVPTPESMAAADPATLVVAMRGSRLCHGALVARERGVHALFGVGDVVAGEGDTITLDAAGQCARAE